MQVGRPVADQHRALQGGAELAVLDLVGLGALEHVFARGDVDLAAAEIRGVDAVLHRGQNFCGIAAAGQHVGVGHARHRHVGIALAAAVAGGLHVHQPRVLAVLHVADQNAVLDQHGAVGRRALVVDGKRATPRGHGAVVDDGDALGRDLLAHQACEGRGLLAVEVAFEAMTDRLMQHHAGPAGAQHHVHLAGGGGDQFQVDQRLADRAVGGLAPRLGFDEARIALAAAITLAAALLPVALAGDHGNIDPHQRADVAIALAVGPQDLDHLPGGAQADGSLPHPRVLVAHIGVDLGQQFYLGLKTRRIQRIVVAIEPHIGMRRRRRKVAAVAAAHGRHRIRRADQRRQGHVGGMRIADHIVLHRTQAEPLAGVVGRLLQPAIVEAQSFGLAIFQKQLAIVSAGQPPRDLASDGIAVEVGAVEEGGCSGIGHAGSNSAQMPRRPRVRRDHDGSKIVMSARRNERGGPLTAACHTPRRSRSG